MGVPGLRACPDHLGSVLGQHLEITLKVARNLMEALRVGNNGRVPAVHMVDARIECHRQSYHVLVSGRATVSTSSKYVRQKCEQQDVGGEKKRKEKFTLFSDHNGSLQRRQPGADVVGASHVSGTLHT